VPPQKFCLDGQHADSEADQRRTAAFEGEGWHVVRFWDNEVLANTDGVIEVILQALQET
jgi:very-short-patch-repair endonuclease